MDHAYNGDLADELYAKYHIILEIVAKPSEQQGFVVVPRRWVVERRLYPNKNEEQPYTRKIKNASREIKLELCA